MSFDFHSQSDTPLETYEWDQIWWERTEDRITPRVLYIGDSISCGTRPAANKAANGKVLFDAFSTSKALDNRYFRSSLISFTNQQPHTDMIIINNGLHGLHLNEEQYMFYYRDMLRFLSCNFPHIPLAVALTTYCEDENLSKCVSPRNECVMKLAKEMDIPVIDLYSVSCENKALLDGGKVHFTPKGYEILGEHLAARAIEIMKL